MQLLLVLTSKLPTPPIFTNSKWSSDPVQDCNWQDAQTCWSAFKNFHPTWCRHYWNVISSAASEDGYDIFCDIDLGRWIDVPSFFQLWKQEPQWSPMWRCQVPFSWSTSISLIEYPIVLLCNNTYIYSIYIYMCVCVRVYQRTLVLGGTN